jgi:hypothetical protein
VAAGFGQRNWPLSSRQRAVGHFHRTELLAGGTGWFEQAGLFNVQVFHHMARVTACPILLAASSMLAKVAFSGEAAGLEIDTDFFGDFVEGPLIFGRPGALEHWLILELRTRDRDRNNAQSISETKRISY